MIEWQNNKTKLNADNMNHMDEYIEYLSNVTSYLSHLGIQLDDVIRGPVQNNFDAIFNTIGTPEGTQFAPYGGTLWYWLNDSRNYINTNIVDIDNCKGGINAVSGRVYNCEGGIDTLNTNLYNLTQNVTNNYYTKSEIDVMISSVENALHQMNTGDEVVE